MARATSQACTSLSSRVGLFTCVTCVAPEAEHISRLNVCNSSVVLKCLYGCGTAQRAGEKKKLPVKGLFYGAQTACLAVVSTCWRWDRIWLCQRFSVLILFCCLAGIGHQPNSGFLNGQLQLDGHGYVQVHLQMMG